MLIHIKFQRITQPLSLFPSAGKVTTCLPGLGLYAGRQERATAADYFCHFLSSQKVTKED
jgi:hypothetical protein